MQALILILCAIAGVAIYLAFVRPIVTAIAAHVDRQADRRIQERAQVEAAKRKARARHNVGNNHA